MPIIELKKKTPEQILQDNIVLRLENDAARGCLKAVYRQVEEIKQFAENNEFDGDMFICGTANNILFQIKYILGKEG